VSLLQIEGFVLFNRRGSHCTFHRADGRLVTMYVRMDLAIPVIRPMSASCWRPLNDDHDPRIPRLRVQDHVLSEGAGVRSGLS
jgi:hypothetical protein